MCYSYGVYAAECLSHLSLLWRLSWDLAQESFIVSALYSHAFFSMLPHKSLHPTLQMGSSLVPVFLLHKIYIAWLNLITKTLQYRDLISLYHERNTSTLQ